MLCLSAPHSCWAGRSNHDYGSLATGTPKMTVDYMRHYVDHDMLAPANVRDLSVTDISNTSMALSWTAPGDDDSTGTATKYDFRYSTVPITNWDEATPFPLGAPQYARFRECR